MASTASTPVSARPPCLIIPTWSTLPATPTTPATSAPLPTQPSSTATVPAPRKRRRRPPKNYVALIAEAMLAAPTSTVTLPDIYAYLQRAYPAHYGDPQETGWRNTVRYNLSRHACFQKMASFKYLNDAVTGGGARSSTGGPRTAAWTFSPGYRTYFAQGGTAAGILEADDAASAMHMSPVPEGGVDRDARDRPIYASPAATLLPSPPTRSARSIVAHSPPPPMAMPTPTWSSTVAASPPQTPEHALVPACPCGSPACSVRAVPVAAVAPGQEPLSPMPPAPLSPRLPPSPAVSERTVAAPLSPAADAVRLPAGARPAGGSGKMSLALSVRQYRPLRDIPFLPHSIPIPHVHPATMQHVPTLMAPYPPHFPAAGVPTNAHSPPGYAAAGAPYPPGPPGIAPPHHHLYAQPPPAPMPVPGTGAPAPTIPRAAYPPPPHHFIANAPTPPAMPAVPIPPPPHTAAQEDITTIFVVGFPPDMHEREFQNMFIFSPGFEAATLKIPTRDEMEGAGGAHKKQIIGFAKFRTRLQALEARDILSGRKVDADRGSVLKAEMARKNLIAKRGLANELFHPAFHHPYNMLASAHSPPMPYAHLGYGVPPPMQRPGTAHSATSGSHGGTGAISPPGTDASRSAINAYAPPSSTHPQQHAPALNGLFTASSPASSVGSLPSQNAPVPASQSPASNDDDRASTTSSAPAEPVPTPASAAPAPALIHPKPLVATDSGLNLAAGDPLGDGVAGLRATCASAGAAGAIRAPGSAAAAAALARASGGGYSPFNADPAALWRSGSADLVYPAVATSPPPHAHAHARKALRINTMLANTPNISGGPATTSCVSPAWPSAGPASATLARHSHLFGPATAPLRTASPMTPMAPAPAPQMKTLVLVGNAASALLAMGEAAPVAGLVRAALAPEVGEGGIALEFDAFESAVRAREMLVRVLGPSVEAGITWATPATTTATNSATGGEDEMEWMAIGSAVSL
ncbi:hypothetical protein GGF31_008557 [Allomyces arbusculus]|nr:hypothetical protein GGF31_008557 [Allomyces arbusculus]